MAKKVRPLTRKEMFTDEVSQTFLDEAHNLSASGHFKQVYALAKKYLARYPDSRLFAYYEAVYSAEESAGLTQKQIDLRYKNAAAKLRKLLRRLRGANPYFRSSVQNEYYWFSRQPKKQYQLGKTLVAQGIKKAYYSQGVGAVEMAKMYALKGQRRECLRWAKLSEKAWLNYFKVTANWPNSYLFYGASLAYQGRLKEMERAFAKSAKLAKRPLNWSEITSFRKYLAPSLKMLSES